MTQTYYFDAFSGPMNPARAAMESLKRVGEVERIVGITALAREAGMPLSTVRSYKRRGWTVEPLWHCATLIDAAERIRKRLVK